MNLMQISIYRLNIKIQIQFEIAIIYSENVYENFQGKYFLVSYSYTKYLIVDDWIDIFDYS